MPELPEVETVVRGLRSKVVGRIIKKVNIYYENIIEYPDACSFQKKIKNQKINEINRYGKWIIFVLDNYYLLSHLRMEGKYFLKPKGSTLEKHEHVSFVLDNDMELRYMDVRKFGKMQLIEKENINKIGPFLEMGLEPWDKKLNTLYLKEKFLWITKYLSQFPGNDAIIGYLDLGLLDKNELQQILTEGIAKENVMATAYILEQLNKKSAKKGLFGL